MLCFIVITLITVTPRTSDRYQAAMQPIAAFAYVEEHTRAGDFKEEDVHGAVRKHLKEYWVRALDLMRQQNAESACVKILEEVARIKGLVRFYRAQSQLKRLQEEMGNDIILRDADRTFVKKATLDKLQKNKKTEPRIFFLFNDILVYAQPANFGRLTNVRVLHLSLVTVADYPSPDPGVQFCFELRSPQKSVVVSCRSDQGMREWKYSIYTNLQVVLNKRKEFIAAEAAKRSGESKEDDSLADQYRRISSFIGNADVELEGKSIAKCKLCLLPFSKFLKKKVKCVMCLDEVCQKCSSHKAKDSRGKMQPMCDACHGLSSGLVGEKQSTLQEAKPEQKKSRGFFG